MCLPWMMLEYQPPLFPLHLQCFLARKDESDVVYRREVVPGADKHQMFLCIWTPLLPWQSSDPAHSLIMIQVHEMRSPLRIKDLEELLAKTYGHDYMVVSQLVPVAWR